MATVENLANTGPPLDYSYAWINRTTAADPNGALTPLFTGELVLATTPKAVYQAQSKANNISWVVVDPSIYNAT